MKKLFSILLAAIVALALFINAMLWLSGFYYILAFMVTL